jgi:GT2 family glycosyltransferase
VPPAAKIIMNARPAVSAIIVNWNGAHHLRTCLLSLLAQSFQSLEIIVVDNGSKDDSADVARELRVRWLPLGANVGLAPALNRGAAIASGDFLLFVNNDMRFDPGFLAALLGPLKNDEGIFATDAMQFNWDGNERVHLAARLAKSKPRGHASVELVPGLFFYQREELEKSSVFMGSAACMLVRRAFFEKLRGFDERLPLGYEDVELCWRAWLRGWKIVYVPLAVCWHRVGSSGRSPEGMRMNFRGILRGRLLLSTKLLPLRYAFRTWLVSTAGLGLDVVRLRWSFAKDSGADGLSHSAVATRTENAVCGGAHFAGEATRFSFALGRIRGRGETRLIVSRINQRSVLSFRFRDQNEIPKQRVYPGGQNGNPD